MAIELPINIKPIIDRAGGSVQNLVGGGRKESTDAQKKTADKTNDIAGGVAQGVKTLGVISAILASVQTILEPILDAINFLVFGVFGGLVSQFAKTLGGGQEGPTDTDTSIGQTRERLDKQKEGSEEIEDAFDETGDRIMSGGKKNENAYTTIAAEIALAGAKGADAVSDAGGFFNNQLAALGLDTAEQGGAIGFVLGDISEKVRSGGQKIADSFVKIANALIDLNNSLPNTRNLASVSGLRIASPTDAFGEDNPFLSQRAFTNLVGGSQPQSSQVNNINITTGPLTSNKQKREIANAVRDAIEVNS